MLNLYYSLVYMTEIVKTQKIFLKKFLKNWQIAIDFSLYGIYNTRTNTNKCSIFIKEATMIATRENIEKFIYDFVNRRRGNAQKILYRQKE